LASVLAWGASGRPFESGHPDRNPSKSLIINQLDGVEKTQTGQIRDNIFLAEGSEGPSSKKKMFTHQKSPELQKILGYTVPKLTTGKCWFISFYAFDPVQNKLRRKRIKINEIDKVTERRVFAAELLKRLTLQLMKGWNPWIELENAKAYTTFNEACDAYRRYVDKLYKEAHIREETYTGYVSYLNNLRKYNGVKGNTITYIYQFTVDYCSAFLDHIWLDRGNSGQTRDNYLGWLRVFSSYLIEKQYIKVNPTAPIKALGKKKGAKQRTVIDPAMMRTLSDHLAEHNKPFLLASYILYYCFIRPKEMSHIRIEHISIKNGTVFIPGQFSKNKKDGIVTLPDKVLKLMLDLEVFSKPGSFYLFGEGFMPSAVRKDEKQFRDYWGRHLRPRLKLSNAYKFYSLKDTGITDLIRANKDLMSVRDQARHHSLLMTDIYTPHDIQVANEELRRHETDF